MEQADPIYILLGTRAGIWQGNLLSFVQRLDFAHNLQSHSLTVTLTTSLYRAFPPLLLLVCKFFAT